MMFEANSSFKSNIWFVNAGHQGHYLSPLGVFPDYYAGLPAGDLADMEMGER